MLDLPVEFATVGELCEPVESRLAFDDRLADDAGDEVGQQITGPDGNRLLIAGKVVVSAACEANQVSTNGTRSPFLTVNSATVVKSFPSVLTGVRKMSPFGPAIASSPPCAFRTHGIVRP